MYYTYASWITILHFIFTDHGADNEKAREDMMYSFRSGTSACLVCIDNIKKEEPVSIYFMYFDQNFACSPKSMSFCSFGV